MTENMWKRGATVSLFPKPRIHENQLNHSIFDPIFLIATDTHIGLYHAFVLYQIQVRHPSWRIIDTQVRSVGTNLFSYKSIVLMFVIFCFFIGLLTSCNIYLSCSLLQESVVNFIERICSLKLFSTNIYIAAFEEQLFIVSSIFF